MAKLKAKAILKADFHITEITPEGTMTFAILNKDSVIMKASLHQQELCEQAIAATHMKIIGEAANQVKWEIGTVYQYLSIVQYADECMCERPNCAVNYDILEERIRTYGDIDSKLIIDKAKRQVDSVDRLNALDCMI